MRKIYYGWWIVAGLSVTELVSWGVLIYAYPVLIIPMHHEMGWSWLQMNLGYATGVATSGVAGVPIGRWLQRHGPRALMTAGSLLTVIALVAWSRVRSVPEFFAVSLLAGVAMAATLYEPALATTSVWFDRNRARAVLVITMVAGLASLAFAPFTAWMIGRYGWRDAILVLAGIAALVGIPIHAVVLRPAPAGRRVIARGGPTGLRRRRSFAWLATCLTLGTLAKSIVVVGLTTYLVGRGYSLPTAALAAGGIGLFQIGGRIALVSVRGRWPEQQVAAGTFLAQAAAVAPLLLTTGHGPVASAATVVFVVVFGSGCGLVELLRGTLLPDYYGVEQYPRINGIVGVFVVGARAAAPMAVGLLLGAAGTLAPALTATAAFTAIGGASLLLAERAHRRETVRLSLT